MDWQPIENAPRDGTPFLGWCGERAVMLYWCDGWDKGIVTEPSGTCWAVYGDGCGVYDEGWDEGTGCKLEPTSQPTHWMPLPDSPDRNPEGEKPQALSS